MVCIITHMSTPTDAFDLTRRERQIMNLVYQRGKATAVEIQEGIPEPPSNAGVRTILRVLVQKGQLRVERNGARFVYRPCTPANEMRRTALRQLVRIFFAGSHEDAMLALLRERASTLDPDTEQELRALIRSTRTRGRK